jgi:hypothetical protein
VRLLSTSRNTRRPTAKDGVGGTGAPEVASPLPPLAPITEDVAGRCRAGAVAARAVITATLTARTAAASVSSRGLVNPDDVLKMRNLYGNT